MRNLGRVIGGAVVALALSSCSVVDNFSDRAVKYNLVAEEAQQQALLLNIVRASLNRPMQFTTLSSITGTASVSGNETLTIPFGELAHRPKTGVSPDIFGASGTVSGGPTFTVPVLDTQEFYQGELKPLSGQEYRFFLDEGITPSVLFYLFVDTIQLTVVGTKPADTYTFHSYVLDDFDNDRYETVADYLLSLGLSIEQVHRQQSVGPVVSAAQLSNLRDIAQLTNAGLHITPVRPGRQNEGIDAMAAPSGKTAHNPAAAKVPTHYQIEKDLTTYRPCFTPPANATAQIDPPLRCGSQDPEDFATPGEASGSLERNAGGITLPGLQDRLDLVAKNFLAVNPTANPAQVNAARRLPAGAKFQVRLFMRSPEAILHFLGSIVARELYPPPGVKPGVVRVKVGAPYVPYPADKLCEVTPEPYSHQDIDGYHCDNLFVLLLGQTAGAPLSVEYDGKDYAVPADDSINGRTTRLLDIIKQIMALHTSAKELPASNVLNIIGGPSP